MGEAYTYKAGDIFYVYFEGKFRRHLRKNIRDGNIFFVDLKTIESNIETDKDEYWLIALAGSKVFTKDHPFGGYGICLAPDDKHILSRAEFDELRVADDDEIISFCDECGFKLKTFKAAIEPFRIAKAK